MISNMNATETTILPKEYRDVNYNQFIDFVFLQNDSKKRIYITFTDEKIKTVKDLFKFCLDLFCKGIVFVYGSVNKSVELNSLSIEQIQYIIDKLSYTGIITMIRMLDVKGILNDGCEILRDSLSDLDRQDDNLELNNYFVIIRLQQVMIEIRFHIDDN